MSHEPSTPSDPPAEEKTPHEARAMPSYSLWAIVLYFLRLGTFGFGGPVALVGYVHRDLVERRKWISDADYKEGLALAQLAPGPLAAQLAIYLGYVHYRILGATLAGIAFVIPSFLMVVALGWAYTRYGGLECWRKDLPSTRSRPKLPQPHGVVAGACQRATFRREGECADAASVAAQCQALLAGDC